ncbi:hypothetical protein WA026_020272 [Henosepilachna vigintioctopunctata]|uniref:Uncharacterized protein n=1 Tax=Henosepilachna vigintioctopunctata TaxID=420089 RepID=A0AAW1TRF1_9CUCU
MKTTIILNWLYGGMNRRFHTSCSVSPCGHFIMAGSENSLINIWNVKTGKYVGNLIPFDGQSCITINALSINPKDNMLAIGHFGSRLPVLLLRYDQNNMKKNKN